MPFTRSPGILRGFERYECYKAHEKAVKLLELRILLHAFPESHLAELPFLWDRNYLADKQVPPRIDRAGGLGLAQRMLKSGEMRPI